jgi:HK97 family phage portal protein
MTIIQRAKNWLARKAADLLPAPISMRGRYSRVTGYGYGRYNPLLIDRLPGTKLDYAREAGDLLLSSAVAICIQYICRQWPQCPPVVKRVKSDGEEETVKNHPVVALLKHPSPGVPGSLFWEWVVTDYLLLGNAYIRLVRGMGGIGPVQYLQYLPGDMVTPEGDGRSNNLVQYTYRVDGQPYPLRVDDVIHLRQGRDPHDWRLGRARILAGLREIVADNASSTAAVGFSKNGGVKTTILAPKDEDGAGGIAPPTAEEARQIKRELQEQVSGDNAGRIAIMTGGFQAHDMGYSPREMDFGTMRKTPEERIAALFGIPAVVLGFGAGLERSTYNNMAEARQQAWEDGILPIMAYVAEALTIGLLSEYPETQAGDYVCFDPSNVRALMDDVDAAAKRSALLFEKGVVDRATAKRIAGQTSDDPEDEGAYAALPADNSAPIGLDGTLPPIGATNNR